MKKISQKVPLVIGIIPLFAAGVDAFLTADATMVAACFSLIAANFTAIKSIEKNPYLVSGILMIFNGFFAAYLSYDYFQQAKVGLPYAWLIVTIANLIAAIFFLRKHKSNS